mgnify:CR=1 FL=1
MNQQNPIGTPRARMPILLQRIRANGFIGVVAKVELGA